jgi:hypothetical protein
MGLPDRDTSDHPCSISAYSVMRVTLLRKHGAHDHDCTLPRRRSTEQHPAPRDDGHEPNMSIMSGVLCAPLRRDLLATKDQDALGTKRKSHQTGRQHRVQCTVDRPAMSRVRRLAFSSRLATELLRDVFQEDFWLRLNFKQRARNL